MGRVQLDMLGKLRCRQLPFCSYINPLGQRAEGFLYPMSSSQGRRDACKGGFTKGHILGRKDWV
jgi:hypothetical protein